MLTLVYSIKKRTAKMYELSEFVQAMKYLRDGFNVDSEVLRVNPEVEGSFSDWAFTQVDTFLRSRTLPIDESDVGELVVIVEIYGPRILEKT